MPFLFYFHFKKIKENSEPVSKNLGTWEAFLESTFLPELFSMSPISLFAFGLLDLMPGASLGWIFFDARLLDVGLIANCLFAKAVSGSSSFKRLRPFLSLSSIWSSKFLKRKPLMEYFWVFANLSVKSSHQAVEFKQKSAYKLRLKEAFELRKSNSNCFLLIWELLLTKDDDLLYWNPKRKSR